MLLPTPRQYGRRTPASSQGDNRGCCKELSKKEVELVLRQNYQEGEWVEAVGAYNRLGRKSVSRRGRE